MTYNPFKPPYLECQDCGEKLRELSQEEQKIVAERPYDFVLYCRECKIYHQYGDL